jgi:hypothetical protein
MSTNGKAIAMAVCGMILSAAPSVSTADSATKEAKVKCAGINECKGKSACATAKNACAGHNGCKGQGWLEVTAKECTAKKGKVVADSKPATKPAQK